MELLQLRYFKALAENGNLTNTSKALYISPPSLSSTISRLERELGTELFDRRNSRMYLNKKGGILLDSVNQILNGLDNAISEIHDLCSQSNSVLSIATTSPNVWIELFSSFQMANPDILLTHTALRLDELQNPNCLGSYDFVIASPSDAPPSWKNHSILYQDDYPVLLVHPDHPLSKRRQISLDEVSKESFVALTPGFSSRKYFDDLCSMAGFIPHIAIECDYMMRSYMVMQKIGIALATAYTNQARLFDGTCCIDIVEPVFPRVQALFCAERKHINSTAIAFHQFACSFYPGQSCFKKHLR